jgi:hypothetical protein
MATEKLGKAHLWKHGRPKQSHQAFVSFLLGLKTDRKAQRRLDYEGQNENWMQTLRKCESLADRIESLAPALSAGGPNPEYPWPEDAPKVAPAQHTFAIWQELNNPVGLSFLSFLSRLFGKAHEFL